MEQFQFTKILIIVMQILIKYFLKIVNLNKKYQFQYFISYSLMKFNNF